MTLFATLSSTLHRSRPGAMLLISVLVAGAMAILIALSVALGGIRELSQGFAENQSQETLAIADGCMQEALLRLGMSSAYAGATLSVGDGTCIITVTSNGSQRTISITATISRWTRKLQAQVNLTGGKVVLLQWKQNTN